MKRKNSKYDSANEEDQVISGLSFISKENPFIVPEGYFESLPTKISERIELKREEPFWVKAFQLIKKPAYAAVLSLISIIIVASIFIFHKQNTDDTSLLSDITFNDLMNENPELIENMDVSLLIEAYASADNSSVQQYLDNQIDNDINVPQDQLINYLSDDPLNSDY